jgi:hypothetical protein
MVGQWYNANTGIVIVIDAPSGCTGNLIFGGVSKTYTVSSIHTVHITFDIPANQFGWTGIVTFEYLTATTATLIGRGGLDFTKVTPG